MNKPKRIIRSVSQLLTALKQDNRKNQRYWFRGHSKKAWTLLPHLARRRHWLEAERDLITRFKQNAIMLVNHPARLTEWDWLSIMQHHGVPTRLLDWTENPLVALYFAVHDFEKENGVLWTLSPCTLNQKSNLNTSKFPNYIPSTDDEAMKNYMPETLEKEKGTQLKPIAVMAPRNTSRMQAQLAAFTICHRDLTPIEEIGDKKHCYYYEIPNRSKRYISDELEKIGIRQMYLFPELQSVGEHLRRGLK